MFIEKFPYKSYKSITEKSGSRQYICEDKSLPSVTTILSATKSDESKKALSEWRKREGKKEADRIVKVATGIGTTLHDNLENYIKEKAEPKGPLLVKMMTEAIIKNAFPKVDEFWGLEVSLYSKELYAGTADVVCVHDGMPCIADFKNSRKPKKFEWLSDYRCQLAAYALAHNEMFGTKIKKGAIFMITRDCEYQEFIIEGKLFDESVTWWLTRLERYLSAN